MPLPADVRDAFLIPDGAIYLDTASNAPRTRRVDAALREAWSEQAAPWRLSFADWEAHIERVRTQASRLFHVDLKPEPDAVALVPSVAHAMSTVASGWPLQPSDIVGIVDGEFPSALLPWQMRCEATGATLQSVPREDASDGFVDLIERRKPAVIVLSHAHWRDGRLLDLDRVAMTARAHHVPVVLDLSQSLGVLPCDVERWQPAFAMSVGYKWWLAHKGLCALWVSPEWRGRLQPLEQHWQGRLPAQAWRFDTDEAPPYRAGARRFDGGEISDPLRLAITEAGLHDVLEWTPRAISERLGELVDRLKQRLAAAGLAHWYVEPSSPHLLGLAPDQDRIDAVRTAFADNVIICIERDNVFRLAPHLHIDERDIDRVADVVIGAR
ncbi:aminotransferase class V-fold PLP-dependent enzyme [Lysobacter sp. HA35]